MAIDGSEPSIKAAELGIDLARKYKTEMIILSVSYIPLLAKMVPKEILTQWHNDNLEELHEWCLPIKNKAQRENIQLKIELIETRKSIVGIIIEYAEREKVDLILVGTAGRTGFAKMFLGSVASGLATYASCPVLIVK